MKRSLGAAVLVASLICGCGGAAPPRPSQSQTQPQTTGTAVQPTRVEPKGAGTSNCEPAVGTGTMGVCTPQTPSSLKGITPPTAGRTLIPDVSEYNGCALHSEAIVRVYEAGTGREDSKAGCHMSELMRLHAWAAAYSFLRAGNCTGQAERTVQIVHGLEGHTHVVVQVIVADAEVYLQPGCVSAFNSTTRRYGYRAVTYTAPGTWPGGAFNSPTWIAAYPYRPSCFSNACPYVAHQFADNFNCRGVVGDCSIDLGITSITRAKPLSPAQRRALEARQRALRRVLLRYGCRRRKAQGEQLGPKCTRWFHEGNVIAERLRRNR